jgi:hypothetical protein
MNILIDGILIFLKYSGEIFVFFVAVLGLGFFSIKYTLTNELNPKIRLLAAFSIGSVVLSVITYALVVLSHFWPFLLRPGSFIILFFSILVLSRGIWSKEIKIDFDILVVLGTIALFLLLIIRLAFLKRTILPSYSDSPIHYQIVFGVLHPEALNNLNLSLENILGNYYHFGFHSLVVWLSSISKIDPVNTISLLGQLFLVIGPVSVLFLVFTFTKDSNAALFAGLLAAVGWHMPAFAVNWGKFPALSALATLPTVIAILNLRSSGNDNKTTNLFLVLILFVGISLMHTRIVICIFLTAICFFLSNRVTFGEKMGFFQGVGYSLLFIISLWPLLQYLTDFYSNWPLSFVLIVLLPFAFQVYPRLAMGVFLFIFGTWLIGIAPALFNRGFQTLLDKQFIEMMLYIPFSIMGGAGFSGIVKKTSFFGTLRWSPVIVFVAFVLLSFRQGNSIYPDSCCDYFNENDRLAFEWIQANTSESTLVLISAFDNSGRIVGTDAGIWLSPLIGQPTNKLPFDISWDSSDEIEKICQLGTKEVLIYMGGRHSSFDNTELAYGRRAKLVFKSGKTHIYQVSECQK